MMDSLFLHVVTLFGFALLISCQSSHPTAYVCPPCNQSCDTIVFDGPGVCHHCQMHLILQSDLIASKPLPLDDTDLKPGSGAFLVEGGSNRSEKTITVHYYMPTNFSPNSKILMVIPGAGRNGDSYRDAWIEEADLYNVLILSLEYEEENYPFEDYHLCGVMQGVNLREAVTFVPGTNIAQLNEDSLQFEINSVSETWLFADFDRIFELVAQATKSNQRQYDLFGHSAGGQILHRMAIFYPHAKANRIIAANPGFYTLPDSSIDLPFGVNGLQITPEQLANAFGQQLIILVGELDNENESGGTLLRSPTVDQQGLHRLARGRHFFNQSASQAQELGYDFRWRLELVPGVGHDHRKMGDAASELLYGSN